MMFSVPLTFTSCISFLLAVLAAAGAAVAQWNTVSHPAVPKRHTISSRTKNTDPNTHVLCLLKCT